MTLRRAWIIAAGLTAAAMAPALAQFPPVGTPQPGQFAPATTQQQPAPQAQQSSPPCVAEFMKLRDETEKRGKALQAANQRHAPPKEACGLFNSFTAAEAKLLKYATDNALWCGIPQQIIGQIKQAHGKAMEIRTRVCEAAAHPQIAPHAPTLSDALGTPTPVDANNIKSGRGTFDTLTGTPLAPK